MNAVDFAGADHIENVAMNRLVFEAGDADCSIAGHRGAGGLLIALESVRFLNVLLWE